MEERKMAEDESFFSWNLCGCVKVRAVIIVYVKCIFFALASVDAKANRVLYVCERERKKDRKKKNPNEKGPAAPLE